MRRPFLDLRYRFTSLVAIAAVAVASLPAPALAQDSENIAAARSLGIQGVKLAEEGKCKEAIEKLERAEALYHAPTILGRLGECQVQVGQIVRGTENLNKVVRDPALRPKFSEDYQADYYRATLAMAAKVPTLRGMSPWVLKDFRSPRRERHQPDRIERVAERRRTIDRLAASDDDGRAIVRRHAPYQT